MKFTQHLILAVLLIPTAAILIAAAISLVAQPEMPIELPAQYAEMENQP